DPKSDKLGGISFGGAADEYLAAQMPGWSNAKHRYQWQTTLGPDYCAAIRGKASAAITTEDVGRGLAPLWQTKHATAVRLRGRIERVLDFAADKEHRTDPNPARWRGKLEPRLSKRRKLTRGHLAALPYDDVPGFLAGLHDMEGTAVLALEFAILTAA